MKKILYWLLPVAWMILIFLLSSQTKVKVSDVYEIQFLIFKSFHVIEYAILYVLVYRALKNTSGAPDWQNRYNALLIAIFYGISDEIHQMFVPTREGRVRDMGIDAIGVTISYFLLWKLLPKLPRRLKNWAKQLQLI